MDRLERFYQLDNTADLMDAKFKSETHYEKHFLIFCPVPAAFGFKVSKNIRAQRYIFETLLSGIKTVEKMTKKRHQDLKIGWVTRIFGRTIFSLFHQI
jgi:hypothetical protein